MKTEITTKAKVATLAGLVRIAEILDITLPSGDAPLEITFKWRAEGDYRKDGDSLREMLALQNVSAEVKVSHTDVIVAAEQGSMEGLAGRVEPFKNTTVTLRQGDREVVFDGAAQERIKRHLDSLDRGQGRNGGGHDDGL